MGPFISPRVPLSIGSNAPESASLCGGKFSVWPVFKFLQLALPLVFLFLFSITAFGQTSPEKVLIISGYDPSYPAVGAILRTITSTIRNGSPNGVEFFYEIQESLETPNTKYEAQMASYLRSKYGDEKLSLVLCLGSAPLRFLLNHESELFQGVPKTYYFQDQLEEHADKLWPKVTGVWASLGIKKTLEIALALQPDIQQIAVISGSSNEDKFLREETQREFRDYESRVRFTYLTDLSMQQLKTELSKLSPQTAVIYVSFLVDKDGNSFTGPDAVKEFSPSSNAPIYGISDTYMGYGVVGGSVLDFDKLGKVTGQTALRMMRGEKPENISPQTIDTTPQFDARQLRRWHLDPGKLPAGSIVLFPERSLWAQYKWYVLIAVAAFIVQGLLILGLLFTRNRRKLAERESNRLGQVAANEHKRLDEVVSNVPGIVWEIRFNQETGEFQTSFISDQVEKMLGYKVEEWLAKPRFGRDLVHEEDRERVDQETQAIITGSKPGVTTFRWLTKDRRTLWVEAHLAPIVDETGRTVGVRGVTLDITGQQRAEDARKQSEERSRALLEAIPDLMFLQTQEGVYLDFHAKDIKDLAVPPELFLGKNMRDVLPSQLCDAFANSFEKALNNEGPQIVEYELPLNGTHKWFEARVVLTNDNILTVVRDVTLRKQAENALSQNRAQLAGIISSAMDGIITVDSSRKIILFNSAAEKLFGCSADDAVGKSIDEFIPERYREPNWPASATNGRRTTAELIGIPGDLYGVRAASGEQFPIEASISQIELNQQKFYTIILRDITEAKRAVDALRNSEERFSKAFKSNPQPMSLTTIASGLYLDVNDSFLNMSGYTREEILGHTSVELGVWGTREKRRDFIHELDLKGSLVNVETRFRTKNGPYRVLLSSAERIIIDGRECLLMASSDITDRVAAQQALRESEARFRNMADTAPVMIWISDDTKQCTYCNKQWLTFTGRTMEEEKGDGWLQGIHKDDVERCANTYSTAFDARRPFEMEYRLRRHDGKYRWIFDCGAPRVSSDSVFLGYIGSCLDITELKESEGNLKTALEELHELKNQLEAENIYLQEELQMDQPFGEIVGHSDAIKYVTFKITQVAPTDSTVLITGETGTGKELVARAIHGASSRKDRALIKVNCGALAPTLIESELFGHEKGAFTGAALRKLGRFELADGGTIFLDEIGELPLDLQVKLLRVLQEGEFERLGGTKTLKTDVRIIAATNRNLKTEVEEGTFREDLWYRLNVYPITVPPLRQRKEDIPLLVEHFVAKYAKKFGKTITSVSPRAVQSLQLHSWPGNIRELANIIERAVIHTSGSVLNVVDRFEPTTDEQPTEVMTLEEVERDYILKTLENTGWRIEGAYGAAKILGLNPSTLRTRMLKLGIQRRRATYV